MEISSNQNENHSLKMVADSPLKPYQKEFLKLCIHGRVIDAITHFFTDDAFQIEVNGYRREGKDQIIKFEEDLIDRFRSLHQVEILSIAVAYCDESENIVAIVAYNMRAQLKPGGTIVWPEQVQVSTWKDKKIAALHYYGRLAKFERDTDSH